jgi:hypothetical protein
MSENLMLIRSYNKFMDFNYFNLIDKIKLKLNNYFTEINFKKFWSFFKLQMLCYFASLFFIQLIKFLNLSFYNTTLFNQIILYIQYDLINYS